VVAFREKTTDRPIMLFHRRLEHSEDLGQEGELARRRAGVLGTLGGFVVISALLGESLRKSYRLRHVDTQDGKSREEETAAL
jgi:hypothetical protein